MPSTRSVSLIAAAAAVPDDLRALATRAASAIASGAMPAPPQGTSARVTVARVELHVVTWVPGATSRLHDRGGAGGAFAVAGGVLTEYVPTGWSDGWMWLRPVIRAAGDPLAASTVFGRHHIHELVNETDELAISVHAYLSALVAPRYYEVAGGELVRAEDRGDAVDLTMRWAS